MMMISFPGKRRVNTMTKIWITRNELRRMISEDYELDRPWEDVDLSDDDAPQKKQRYADEPQWQNRPLDRKQWHHATGLNQAGEKAAVVPTDLTDPDDDPDVTQVVRQKSNRRVVGGDLARQRPLAPLPAEDVDSDFDDDHSYASMHTDYAGRNVKPTAAIKQVRGRGDKSKLYPQLPRASDPYTPNELRHGIDVADSSDEQQIKKPGVLDRLKNMFGKKQPTQKSYVNDPSIESQLQKYRKMQQDALTSGDSAKAQHAKKMIDRLHASRRT